MTEVLNEISKQLLTLKLTYEFGQMSKSPPIYPYWVGEYTADPTDTEDGLETSTITLTGFVRDKFLELEKQKDKIKDHFKNGVSVITKSGSAVVIFYAGSLTVPTDDSNLKRCQINLQIKKWKV